MSEDYSHISTEELKAIHEDIGRELQERSEAERQDVAEQIRVLADSVGLTVEDILASTKSKGNGAKVRVQLPAKYRNPSNPDQTWSGRGKRPAWYSNLISSGVMPNDLLI